ncbi:MAG TPA: hypothetical protein VGU44_04125, partial [Gammaproteobacteria bacterium]|nr:hypothetical protein [Gammaproteobacteria bacterium]
VTASSSAVEAPSQPAEEPNDATSAPMKKTIEELEAEIDILEKEIKRMFKLYNPTSTDLLKYSGLSRTSTEQKNIITKRKEKNEDFYEPALAYKEALKAQLEEIKSKVISPIVQEFKPLEKSENAFIKDVKSIAAGIGRSIGRSPVGQFFKWVGEGFQSGLNALFGSKLSEKTADQPLSNASEAVELVEMQLAEQLSATSNAIQQIHQTRPTIPLNEAPNDNATLFSKALSPSEELQVGKEAVAQQKLELDKLQRESGNLDSTIFLGNTEALKEMLHQTYELKEDADFRKLWKESGAKEKAYNDLIKSNDPKDLQKIYAAGLEYEKALKAQIAKKHEYLAPEKPGYKSPR